MNSLIKNLLVAFGLAVLLWLAYNVFLRESDEATVENTVSQAAINGRRFVALLEELKHIEIDSSLFTDHRFEALVDFRQELVPESYGRDNPFLPGEESPE